MGVEPRVLLSLDGFAFDPGSGAMRSLTAIAGMLASRSMAVECVSHLRSEAASADARSIVKASLNANTATRRRHSSGVCVLEGERRGVRHTVGLMESEDAADAAFAAVGEARIEAHDPKVVLTVGGGPGTRRVQEYARLRGCKVVMAVRNHGYYNPEAFACADAVLTPSEFLASAYRERVGIAARALPTPVDFEDTYVVDPDPVFVTFVNPIPAKGAHVFMRIASELSERRPDIPMLVIESRAVSSTFLGEADRHGLSLRSSKSLFSSPALPLPRDVFRHARIMLVPSVWPEPSGRLAAESLVNGVPVIVSDRGGLPETVGEGGRVRELPSTLTMESLRVPSASEVRAWVDDIIELTDDVAAYERAREAGLREARRYEPEPMAEAYADFVRSVLA